jgi:hypothetical protein
MAGEIPDILMQNQSQYAIPDPTKDLVEGYPALAWRISLFPQTGIFRRFGALNARNLLYLQAELHDLEQKLVHAEKTDKSRGRGDFCKDWQDLSESINTNNEEESKQWRLVLKIREKLKEYSALHIAHSSTCALLT